LTIVLLKVEFYGSITEGEEMAELECDKNQYWCFSGVGCFTMQSLLSPRSEIWDVWEGINSVRAYLRRMRLVV